MLLTDPGIFIFITNYLKNRFLTRNFLFWTRTGKTPFKAGFSHFIIVCPFGVGNTANIYAHLDYTSKLSSAKAMISGMALPESVNFAGKWAEISDDGEKN